MGTVIRGVLTGLTPAEKWFLLSHPQFIGTIRADADTARAESRGRFAGDGLHNGRGDAFRHCYWSALLARDIGADNARTFTTAHEAFSDNPAGEREMDLHNNGVGIRIGQSFPTGTDTVLANQCAAALTNGRLVTAPGTPGDPYPY